MIKSLSLRNFKSFRSLDYCPSRLNVFTGLNGSGKSSLIQAMLFLKDVASQSGDSPWHVGLDGENHAFGTYADMHYAYSQSDDDGIKLGIRTSGSDSEYLFSVEDTDSDSDDVVVALSSSSGKTGVSAGDFRSARVMQELKSMQYISAFRLQPMQEHKYSAKRVKEHSWGSMGEYAVAYLAESGLTKLVAPMMCSPFEKDNHLQPQVDAWMGTVSPGVRINAENLGKINRVKLSVSFAKGVDAHPFLPQNVGFGISYVLPVLVMVLRAEEGDCIILENPEAHLHPKGQAEFGRLMALAASSGVQIFVETHSDHILNGIRVAVKQGLCGKDDVKVAFFTREEQINSAGGYEQESRIDEMKINSMGEFDHFPAGFMDEWNKQLMELLA